MKPLSSVLGLVLLSFPLERIAAEEDAPLGASLRFPNGDVLEGSPSGLTEDGFLLWESELFQSGNERFEIRQSDSISLGESSPPPEPSGQEAALAKVTFQPHVEDSVDTMQVELVGFDDQSVQVKTWYAGDLTLKRSMLRQIEVDGKSTPLVNGPGTIDDWNQIGDKGAWQIKAGVMSCQKEGSIARKFSDLPDSLHLSFDLNFETSPYIRIYFFANTGVESRPAETYSIQIGRAQMMFMKKVGRRHIPLELEDVKGRNRFEPGEDQRVDLYVDRKKGLFSLYIEGEVIATARDDTPLMEGDWWHFETRSGRTQSVENFAIRAWDGELPEKTTFLEFREELRGDGQPIELQNRDTILGKVETIEDGKLLITTEFMPISVPIERLKSFEITSKKEGEEPRIYPGGVRAYFWSGGFVSFRLSDISPTTISGYSQVFGDATFDLRAFSHISFNPYNEEFRERRGESN